MTSATLQPVEAAPVPPRSWVAQALLQTLGRRGAQLGATWIIIVALGAVFAPFLASSNPLLLKALDPAASRHAGGPLYSWSSPVLRHLTPVDVVLLVACGAVVGVVIRPKLSLGQALGVVLWVLAAILPLAFWPTVMGRWAAWVQGIGAPLTWTATGLAAAAEVAVLVGVGVALRASRGTWLAMLLPLAAVGALLVVHPVRPPETVEYDRYRLMEQRGEVRFILRAPIPYSPADRLRDQFDPDNPHPWPPSRAHLLGTERYGADILSRMIHACRIAMGIGFVSTGIAVVIGVVIGGLMGYFAGVVDLLGMRLVEIFSFIPQMFLLLTCVAFFGRDLYLMMVIIGLTNWPGTARFIRAEFLKLRHQDFVQAAIACGLPLRSILFRHMLPNGVAPVLVSASFGVASAILAESGLSFLGLGLVDEPSWGQLLNQAVSAGGGFYWWLACFPGLAIFLTVFAYNLVGEALRDAIDPHAKRAAQL